jgi:hypothetical protein
MQLALAETITAIPWTVKPIYGFITDSFPIRGMRRRPYLIISGLLGAQGSNAARVCAGVGKCRGRACCVSAPARVCCCWARRPQ